MQSKKRKIEFEQEKKDSAQQPDTKKVKFDKFGLVTISDHIVPHENIVLVQVLNVDDEMMKELKFSYFHLSFLDMNGKLILEGEQKEKKEEENKQIPVSLPLTTTGLFQVKMKHSNYRFTFQVLEKETNRLVATKTVKNTFSFSGKKENSFYDLPSDTCLAFFTKPNKRLWINNVPVSNALESISKTVVLSDLDILKNFTGIVNFEWTDKSSTSSDVYPVFIQNNLSFIESDTEKITLTDALHHFQLPKEAERYFVTCSSPNKNTWKLKEPYYSDKLFHASGLKFMRNLVIKTNYEFGKTIKIEGSSIPFFPINIDGLGPDVNELILMYWNPTYSITDLLNNKLFPKEHKEEYNLYIENEIGFTSSNLPYIYLHTKYKDQTVPIKVQMLAKPEQRLLFLKHDGKIIKQLVTSGKESVVNIIRLFNLFAMKVSIECLTFNGIQLTFDHDECLDDYGIVHGSVLEIIVA
jgi:hypothetical protein